MDLDDLRGVQASERSTDSLQSLRDSFYREVAEYINGLREERSRAAERADDPFGSEEVRHLTDEIETAEEVAEAIYDRRLGKVVKRASLAAAGMPTDEEGLTDEETALFGAVVEEIESRRGAVLSSFAGESEIPGDDAAGGSHAGDRSSDTALTGDRIPGSTAAADESPVSETDPGRTGARTPGVDAERTEGRVDPEPAGRDGTTAATSDTDEGENAGAVPEEVDVAQGSAAFDASDAMGAGAAESERAREGGDGETRTTEAEGESRVDAESPTPDGGQLAVDRATVRITHDVGEIMGVDEHVYDLADGDVVTLPSANAEPLLDRDAASRLE